MMYPDTWRLSRRLVSHLPAGLKVGVIGWLLLVMAPVVVSASSQNFTVLQGQPQTGMLMSLTAHPGVIEPVTDKNAKSLIGVIAPLTETGIDQAPEPGQVSVQTDGAASALVSTLDGGIRVGDRITASPVAGVGTKATASAWIVGIAQASLDARTAGAVKSTVTDSRGGKRTVHVASIPLLVKVTYYTVAVPPATDKPTWIPAVVQRLADAVASKHVSTRALVLSFLLLIIGVIVAGVVINSAVRGGFLAIARQPLAKSAILREVWRSFGLAFVILAAVLAGAFLLLRLL